MAGTAQHKAYKQLLRALVVARKAKGLSQAKLAARLNKPASFVGKYELAERRLDAIELMVILQVLEVERGQFLDSLEEHLPEGL